MNSNILFFSIAFLFITAIVFDFFARDKNSKIVLGTGFLIGAGGCALFYFFPLFPILYSAWILIASDIVQIAGIVLAFNARSRIATKEQQAIADLAKQKQSLVNFYDECIQNHIYTLDSEKEIQKATLIANKYQRGSRSPLCRKTT